MRVYFEAARPRTLVAGVVPVLAGTAAAAHFIAWRFACALIAAVAVQVAVNYANDYFDFVHGVDTHDRLGPRRLTASGLISPARMQLATALALGVASVPGLALAWVLGPQVIVVGLLCFAAALGYSGGPKPFASLGLGEVFVFVFFGLVGTVGSAYVQTRQILGLAVAVSIPVGFLAAAILLVNNIRDVDTDGAAGKRTLAVRIGRDRAVTLFGGLLVGAFVVTAGTAALLQAWGALAGLGAIPLAVGPIRLVNTRRDGAGLIQALGGTARLQLAFGGLLAAGLWIASAR